MVNITKINDLKQKFSQMNFKNPVYLKSGSIILGGILISLSIVLGSRFFEFSLGDEKAEGNAEAGSCTGDARLDEGCYEKYAKDLNLDENVFSQCLTENKFNDIIDKEVASGIASGVEGTPSLYLGKGENASFQGFYIGGASVEEIGALVDKLTEEGVESTNKYWIDKVKASLPGLEQQAREYYQSADGGSLTGEGLETTVKDFIAGQLDQINKNFLVRELSVGDGNVLGEGDIILMEFSDYECPYCYTFASETLVKIKSDFVEKGGVKYVFRDFPLDDIHPKARSAANAARCAGEQGKYFEYHDKLFAIN